MPVLDTFPDTQSPKVGKTEKTQPAVSKRKSPNQRKYTEVRSREYLLPEEVDAMMKAIKKHGGRHAHRDATVVLLLYRHGLRVSEAAGLRWEQVDFAAATLHVNRLKNGTCYAGSGRIRTFIYVGALERYLEVSDQHKESAIAALNFETVLPPF